MKTGETVYWTLVQYEVKIDYRETSGEGSRVEGEVPPHPTLSLRIHCFSPVSARARSAYIFASELSPRAEWKLAKASRISRSFGWSARAFFNFTIAASDLPVEWSA